MSKINPVHIFIGEETLLMEEALDQLKALMGENAALNTAVYNAEENPNADQIIDLLNTLPFLSDKRLVIIRNFNSLKKPQMNRIFSYAAAPADFSILVLTVESGNALKKGLEGELKPLAGRADLKRFEQLRGTALTDWIISRARENGKTMDRDAACRLADVTGSNTWFIASEVEKLSIYAGSESRITRQDVDALVVPSQEASVFDFADAVFGRKKDVLKRLYDLEQTGSEPLMLIGMLESQTMQHYQIICGPAGSRSTIHPYVAKKIAGRKNLWNPQGLRELLDGLRRIERNIKTGRTDNPYPALAGCLARLLL